MGKWCLKLMVRVLRGAVSRVDQSGPDVCKQLCLTGCEKEATDSMIQINTFYNTTETYSRLLKGS